MSLRPINLRGAFIRRLAGLSILVICCLLASSCPPGVFRLSFSTVDGAIELSRQSPSANINIENGQQFSAVSWDFRSNSPKLKLETTDNRAAFARVRVTAIDFSQDEDTSIVIRNLSDPVDDRRIDVRIIGDPGFELEPTRINLSPSRTADFLMIKNSGGGTLNWELVSNDDRIVLSAGPLLNQSSLEGILTADQEITVVVGATDTGAAYTATLDISDQILPNVSETIDVMVFPSDPTVMVDVEEIELDEANPEGMFAITNDGEGELHWDITSTEPSLQFETEEEGPASSITGRGDATVTVTAEFEDPLNGLVRVTNQDDGSDFAEIDVIVRGTTPLLFVRDTELGPLTFDEAVGVFDVINLGTDSLSWQITNPSPDILEVLPTSGVDDAMITVTVLEFEEDFLEGNAIELVVENTDDTEADLISVTVEVEAFDFFGDREFLTEDGSPDVLPSGALDNDGNLHMAFLRNGVLFFLVADPEGTVSPGLPVRVSTPAGFPGVLEPTVVLDPDTLESTLIYTVNSGNVTTNRVAATRVNSEGIQLAGPREINTENIPNETFGAVRTVLGRIFVASRETVNDAFRVNRLEIGSTVNLLANLPITDEADGDSSLPDGVAFAIAGNGESHYVFENSGPGGGENELFFIRMGTDDSVVVPARNITNNNEADSNPAIVVDDQQRTFVIFETERFSVFPELGFIRLASDGTVEVPTKNLTPGLFATQPSQPLQVVIDSFGDLHVVWVSGDGGQSELYYLKADPDGETLIGPVALTSNNILDQNPQLLIDSNDFLHILHNTTELGPQNIGRFVSSVNAATGFPEKGRGP